MASSVILLINPRAGSVDNASRLSDQLNDAARDLRVETRFFGEHPENLIAQAIESQPDFLVIAGGDGTARAVASQMISSGTSTCLVPLPLGTANLLPRRLYGERNAVSIMRELAGFDKVRLHAGCCQNQYFLIAAGIGFVTHFARAREVLRKPSRRGMLRRLSLSTRLGFDTLLTSWLRVCFDGSDKPLKASAAMVSPGGIASAFSDRIHPDAKPELECVSLRPEHIGELATLGVLAGLDRWRDHRAIETHWSEAVSVDAKQKLEVMLDGEPFRMDGPINITLKPDCLSVAVAPSS